MREQIGGTGAVLALAARGEGAAAAELDACVEVKLGRRHPAHLDAVVGELPAEERLHHERRVGEIPRMRVDLILVADA
jgi:hypothetical protein